MANFVITLQHSAVRSLQGCYMTDVLLLLFFSTSSSVEQCQDYSPYNLFIHLESNVSSSTVLLNSGTCDNVTFAMHIINGSS